MCIQQMEHELLLVVAMLLEVKSCAACEVYAKSVLLLQSFRVYCNHYR